MSQKEFGPKRYDKAKVDAAPNGYKTYDFSEVVDELVVMRKVETAPGDTLEKVWSGAKVRCMYNYGNTFFVGTEQGLMYTRDGEIYTGIDFGEDDEDDEDDQN